MTAHERSARHSRAGRAGGNPVGDERSIHQPADDRGGPAITDTRPEWIIKSYRTSDIDIAIPAEPGIYRYRDGCYIDRRKAGSLTAIVTPSTHDPASHIALADTGPTPDSTPDAGTGTDPSTSA